MIEGRVQDKYMEWLDYVAWMELQNLSFMELKADITAFSRWLVDQGWEEFARPADLVEADRIARTPAPPPHVPVPPPLPQTKAEQLPTSTSMPQWMPQSRQCRWDMQ